MKKLIIINQQYKHCSFSLLYDYNKLPEQVQEKIDEALNNGRIKCDIYQYTIINYSQLKVGKQTEYMGSVEFYTE